MNFYLLNASDMKIAGVPKNEIIKELQESLKTVKNNYKNWQKQKVNDNNQKNTLDTFVSQIMDIEIAIASVEDFDLSKLRKYEQTPGRIAWSVEKDPNNIIFCKGQKNMLLAAEYITKNKYYSDEYLDKLSNAIKDGDINLIKSIIKEYEDKNYSKKMSVIFNVDSIR